MAIMKDIMPETYKGEKKVWECIKNNLPDDIICYYNRTVKGREFDFCLLIKDIGFVMIEVKGWSRNHIVCVKSPDEIILSDGQISRSPRKQAKSYKFYLHNILSERYSVNPLIIDMVCYPFLSEEDYCQTGLSMVTEAEFTLFSEDIESWGLGQKILSAYELFRHLRFDDMSGSTYELCRHHFEPDYLLRPPKQTFIPYSILSVCQESMSLKEIDNIVTSYFDGTKQIIFTNHISDLEKLAVTLSEQFKRRKIKVDKGSLSVCTEQSEEICCTVSENKLILFNFEAYCIPQNEIQNSFVVWNGVMAQSQREVLRCFSKISDFNFSQYEIEHADIHKDIYVRAGAGTGKTYSMVSRIAYLCNPISECDIFKPSEEIAMLTFTTDASVNMKSRLKQLFVNYFILTRKAKYLDLVSDVENMCISTIHSFTKKIIMNTSLPLGVGVDFVTVSGTYEKQQIFDRIFEQYLAKYNEQDPLFFQNMPLRIEHLRKCLLNFSIQLYSKGCDIKNISVKSLGKSPEGMLYLNDMIEKVVIPTEQEYTAQLLENNCLNLAEYMIYLDKAVSDKAFNRNLFKFKYVFIDEFQDTDDAQIMSFLNMQKKLNFKFFIVGDLKQSIYRFRGATMDAFNKMGCSDNSWLAFSLNKNYRSDSRLLEIYERVFATMENKGQIPYISKEDRLTGVKQNTAYHENEMVFVCGYRKDKSNEELFYDELFAVIESQKQKICSQIKKKSLSVNERTIALLVRKNYQVQEIVRQAKKRNIFIESTIGDDLYQLPSTIDLCKLTSALSNPYNPTYLFDIIQSNYVHTDFKLSAIYGLSAEKKVRVMTECLDKFFMQTLGKTWNEVVKSFQNEPFLKSLRMVYENTCPWNKYSSDKQQKEFYRINYEFLFEELSRLNTKNYLTLDSVNQTLHILISTEAQGKARTVLQDNDNGIRIICSTVHKSKGLEYATVILPFTNDNIGTFRRNDINVTYEEGKIGYCLSNDREQFLNEYYDISAENKETVMEEARILYVAMTRAINNFICFIDNDKNGNCWGKMLEELLS